MTRTRLWSASAETQDLSELVKFQSGSPAVSNTKARTGSYSWRVSSTQAAFGFAIFANQDSLSLYYALNHNGAGGSETKLVLGAFRLGNTEVGVVYWDVVAGNLIMEVDGVEVDSVSVYAAGMANTDTWYDLGFNIKKHATTGFFSFYLNGVQVLNFTGNVPDQMDNVVIHMADVQGWAAYAYYDDLYIDNIDGESDSSPESSYFLHSLPDGAGADADWAVVGAGSNYQAVDDAGANDGDTTKIRATSAALRDSYTLGNQTIPANYRIEAVIAYALAKRTNAGVESQFSLGFYDGITYDDGSNQAGLPTAYGYRSERFAVQPDTTDWNETDFNNIQLTVLSAGTF